MKHFVRSIFFLLMINQSLFGLIDLSSNLPFLQTKNIYDSRIKSANFEQNILTQCTELSEKLLPCFHTADKYIKEYFSQKIFRDHREEEIILQKCLRICNTKTTKDEIKTTYNQLINDLQHQYKTKCDIYPLANIKLGDKFLSESNKGFKIIEHTYNGDNQTNRYIISIEAPDTFLNKAIIYTNNNHQIYEVVKLTSYIRNNTEFRDFKKNTDASILEKYNNISNIKSDGTTIEDKTLFYKNIFENKNRLFLINNEAMKLYTSLYELPYRKTKTQKEIQEEILKFKTILSNDDELYNGSYHNSGATIFENDFNFISLSEGERNFLIIRYVNKELLQELIDVKDKFEKMKKEQIEHTEKNRIKEGL